MYIGEAYEWGTEHANRAYQLMAMSSDLCEIELPRIVKPIVAMRQKDTRKLGGKPWLNAIGDLKPTYVSEDVFFGHTFITGLPGSGKTTMMKVLSLGCLHLGHTVLVVDPKDDAEWRESIKAEMRAMGLEHRFYYFNPNKQSESVRLDLIKNWNRHTEIADRLTSLMSDEATSNPFQDIGYKVITQVTGAMLYAGESPQIDSIYRNIANQSDKQKLAVKTLEAYFDRVYGMRWRTDMIQQIMGGEPNKLTAYINHYRNLPTSMPRSIEVDGIMEFVLHDGDHMSKLTASLLPLFSALCAAPLSDLLSPKDDLTDQDTRRIINTREFIKEPGVLYMSLSSLTDSKTASYIAKLFTADLAASAGARYTDQHTNRGPVQRVSLFTDEVHAAIAGNEAMINLLAQGRAAEIQMFLSTQTIPDLEAKVGLPSAQRILGLCNNYMSMKVSDPTTMEYASKQFGDVPVQSVQTSIGHNVSDTAGIADWGGGYQERKSTQMQPSFPETLIGDMPKLQYIARLADGRKLKGVVPVVITN